MGKNKLAYGEWAFSVKGPVGMKLASEIGFDGVHLTDYDGIEANFPMNNPKIQDEYQNAAAKYGLEISGYHLYSLSSQGYIIHPAGSEKGDMARLILKKAVDVCADMKIPSLMITAESTSTPNSEYDTKNYIANLNYTCDYAADKGVTLSFESILPLPKILRMLKDTGNRAKYCYDLMNPYWFGSGEPEEEIKAITIDNIDMIHLKDSPEDFSRRCTLSEGVCKIAEHTRLLLDMGFEGWFVCENYYNKHGGMDPYEAAARDLQAMRALIG